MNQNTRLELTDTAPRSSMREMNLEPYDEVNAESVAHIVGESSATRKALTLLRERRAAGESMALFIDSRNQAVVVATVIPILNEGIVAI